MSVITVKESPCDLEAKSEDHTDASSVNGPNTRPDEQKQLGVRYAEGGYAIPRYVKILALVGLILAAYVNGLDNNTVYAYLITALTHFGTYATDYTTVSCLQQVVLGVVKLPIAKLADVFGRAQAYCASALLYVIGFIIFACAQRTADFYGGSILYAVGNSGIQILQSIVCGDYISSRWRGLSIGLLSFPYIINFGVAPIISASIEAFNWRWGYGMFTILVPICTAPIIVALVLQQKRARKAGIVSNPYHKISIAVAIRRFFRDIDVIGLLILCIGWIMFLVPLNIAAIQPNGWSTGWVIACLTIGGVLQIIFWIWELRFSSQPLIRRACLDRQVILTTVGLFFDFFSFYISWRPVFQWAQVVRGWSYEEAVYFSDSQSISMTVCGILCGVIMGLVRDYKWTALGGAAIRTLGLGLMIRYRSTTASVAAVIIPQILQGFGGGFYSNSMQVATQVNVRHQDMSMVTAFVLLMCEIGGACGTAAAGAVTTSLLLKLYTNWLPSLTSAEIQTIYTDPVGAVGAYRAQLDTALASGDPAAIAAAETLVNGVVGAYSDYTRILVVIGIAFSAIPILCAAMMKTRRLNNKQNVVSDEPTGLDTSKEARTAAGTNVPISSSERRDPFEEV